MEDYGRQRPYGDGGMQIQPYTGGSRDFRTYSTSYGQTQMENPNPNDFKLKNGKSYSGSKSWGLSDPEFQRKKRVASYKMYSVEGKVKGSLRKSFRWKAEVHTGRLWLVVKSFLFFPFYILSLLILRLGF